LEQRIVAVAIATALALAGPAGADTGEDVRDRDESGIEVVVVTGVRLQQDMTLNISEVARPGQDNSDLMRLFPGGNRNANGQLSRISQYRGLIGQQNRVAIDGLGYTPDCPNWMDTPLSSIPQSLTGSITLFRGLGSVDALEEGLGGAIRIESLGVEFSQDPAWSSFGSAEAGGGSNGPAWNAALFTGMRNQDNVFDVAVSKDVGDDYEFAGGTARATEYDREQFRLGYARRLRSGAFRLGAVINRTGPSGAPALPMDIRYIDSEQYRFGLETAAGPGRLDVQLSRLSVDHAMDNFTLRPPPVRMGKPGYRQSAPFGETWTGKLSYRMQMRDVAVLLGMDANRDTHTAEIKDPSNDRFFILNFNDIERQRSGAFAVVTWPVGAWELEADLRYNRVGMEAGEVGGYLGMPSPQQERLEKLAADFNASNRSRSDDHWIAAFKASRKLSGNLRLNAGFGRKMRSPSYQERYLWLPMESTAGLADGRTYIGDVALKPEKSLEVTLGLDWSHGAFELTPEAFLRDIADSIQGVPSTNPVANAFSMMMSGSPPLQYANVDAEMYGFDMGYRWDPPGAWLLRGNISYVRGKRSDVEDNLYRIAPLSSFLELRYERDDWFIGAENVAAGRQDRVAAYNQETETAGWGVLNLRVGLRLGKPFQLGFVVENVFDKLYQDHLGGYNRVMESDVPVGTRLYSKGRNCYLRLSVNW
jgi:iron complex outermembrane receptor protein